MLFLYACPKKVVNSSYAHTEHPVNKHITVRFTFNPLKSMKSLFESSSSQSFFLMLTFDTVAPHLLTRDLNLFPDFCKADLGHWLLLKALCK